MERRDRSAKRTAHADGTATRRWKRIAAAITTTAAIIGGSLVAAASAQAVSHTFVIDSLDATANARGVDVGNGVCESVAGGCTLRAALEEANALNLPKGSILITAAEGLTGNINPTDATAARMHNGLVNTWDGGAHFAVTAPVILDLDNRVTIQTTIDTVSALFYINGPDIEFRNMTQILSGRTSLSFGREANGFVLDGGSTSTARNFFPERFVLLSEGAKNVTIRNYRIQGFPWIRPSSAVFHVNARNNTPIENFRVENVEIIQPNAGVCDAANGSGCAADIVQFYPRSQSVVLNGFTFVNNTLNNMQFRVAFPFGQGTLGTSVRASNIDISHNRFIGSIGEGRVTGWSFITLPHGRLEGENRIVGNEFVRRTTGQGHAISWDGQTTSGSAGNLEITDNHFDGYDLASIWLNNTGDVRVERNTFGDRSGSKVRPGVLEETSAAAPALVSHNGNANGRITTWYPSSDVTVLGGDAPEGTLTAESPFADGATVCPALFDVTAPTGAQAPSGAVDLDVYWTGNRTAEVYLGRVSAVTGSNAKIQVDLPVGAVQLPTMTPGTMQDVTVVDPDSGVAAGFLRLQTQTASQSSQYSRLVPLTGNCRPQLTVERAEGQNNPTLARDLHFTITSTLPLDPESVSSEALELSTEAVDETIDEGRLNPRTVSVEPVPGTSSREFTAVVRVDDSARVDVAIPAESVTGVGGMTNRDPATNDDAWVEYTNPIIATPAEFTVVTGDAQGQQFTFGLRTGAPEPTAEVRFSSDVDEAGVLHGVSLSDPVPAIGPGATASGPIRVTAEDGDVAANTPVVIGSTVVSDDSNYDELVVPPVLVRLFSTDPSLRIEKRAFVGVTDSSSPQQIMATGTEALSGTRLTDGQAVCFVYTVTNVSADDWATQLRDLVITDSDTRLGNDGVIGTIDRLEIGEFAHLSACGSLIPVDTTTGSTR